MTKTLHYLTDRVTTKKGMWLTLFIWIIAATLLALFAPNPKDYEVTTIDSLPADMQSIIAKNKVDQYFSDSDGIPAILVFQSNEESIELAELTSLIDQMEQEKINGIKEIIPLGKLPPQVALTFFSEDQQAALVPVTFLPDLDTKQIKAGLKEIYSISEKESQFDLFITGPAGIASQ